MFLSRSAITTSDVRHLKAELLSGIFPGSLAGLYALNTADENDEHNDEHRPRSKSPLPQAHNIVGLAYGKKEVDGRRIEQHAIKVYVRQKVPKRFLVKSQIIPESINGVVTDVVVTGQIRAATGSATAPDPAAYIRPAGCGTSIGHYLAMAGTLGCIVADDKGERFVLSNNHVLAHANKAQIGDVILQPGVQDAGKLDDKKYWLAKLTKFEPLVFDNSANRIDAAIARVIDDKHVDVNLVKIGKIGDTTVKVLPHDRSISVQKYGRSTNFSQGYTGDTLVDTWIYYDNAQVWYEGQIAIESDDGIFAAGGDSGALIVTTKGNQPVGLLLGIDGKKTYANKIDDVLDRLSVKIVT